MHILSYVKQSTAKFHIAPLNIADILVISWVAYFDFGSVKDFLPLKFKDFRHLPEFKKLGPYYYSFFPKFSRKFMSYMSNSPRFEDAEVVDYECAVDKKNNAKFAVIAVRMGAHIIIGIRGTDPSYVGWKEDFQLAYKDRIHSYSLAETFIKKIIDKYDEKIILCGHSKGGNICTYLLSQLEDVSKIEHVYSFDGPGFRIKGLFKGKEERLKKHTKIIPQSSFVGVIFSNETDVKIVKSDGVLLLQHNPFLWIIKNNDFVYLKKRTLSSKYLERVVNTWIDNLSEMDRERFTEIAFGELDKFDAQDASVFMKKLLLQIGPVTKAYWGLDKEDRLLVNRVLGRLAKTLINPSKMERKQIA